ncbi:MAG: hypothetical protein GXP33_06355 [Spirochaetes bacterium]|nr:hypothetical protein [Spirochaetota bacterium]
MNRLILIIVIFLTICGGSLTAGDKQSAVFKLKPDDKILEIVQYNYIWKTAFIKQLDLLLKNSDIPIETIRLILRYTADELPKDPQKAAESFTETLKKADYAIRLGVAPAEVGVKTRYTLKTGQRKNIMKNNRAKKTAGALHMKSVDNRMEYSKSSPNNQKTKEKPGRTGRGSKP